LSITFDPAYDHPEILAKYADIWKADPKGWRLLTGPLPDIQKVCRMFGVNSWRDEGLLIHSLHTVVIDRHGKLAASLEGNDYTAAQLGDLVQTIMSR
jgi:protein SCO1/2